MSLVADSAVMARRQLRRTVRRPVYLVFAFIQPVMLLLLFRYVFGGAIDPGKLDYVNYLVPGIMVQSVVFGAITTGLGLAEDVKDGVVDRFRSLPMAPAAVLVGRTASDALQNVGTLAALGLVAIPIGFRPGGSVIEILAAFALAIAFAYVFSWVSAWIGLLCKDPETAQSAGFIWVFPLTFVSSAFVPTDTMPSALRWFADINPITLCVDAVRALMTGQGDVAGPALGTVAWLVGLLVVFTPLALRALRRS